MGDLFIIIDLSLAMHFQLKFIIIIPSFIVVAFSFSFFGGGGGGFIAFL